MTSSRITPFRRQDSEVRVPDLVVLSIGALAACAIAIISAIGLAGWMSMAVYGAVSAGAGVWLLTMRTAASDPGWRRYLGAAGVIWGLGQVLLAVEIALGRDGSPGAGDLVSTLALPLLAAGITRAVRGEAFVRPVMRMVIDAVLIGTAASVLVWRLAVAPGELEGSNGLFVAVVMWIDLVVSAFGLLVFIRRPERSTGLFALGLMLFGAGDVLATFRDDLGGPVPAVAGALYCVAMTGFSVGARMVVPEPSDRDDMRRDIRESSATIVITGIVVMLALVHVATYRRVPTLPPITFTVVTILAFFVRHLADHAQRNELLARLHSQASTDPLTRVGNRFVLDDLAASRPTAEMDVIVVGVDGLPSYNNTVGHAEGDALLLRVAAALRDRFVDALALVRLESDQFAIVLDHADRLIDVAVCAHDVADEAAGRAVESSARVRVTVGSASGQSFDRNLLDTVSHAQRARHLASSTPGISVRMYDDAVRARDERDRFIDDRLAAAIDKGHITVHFQPIVLLDTGMVVGAETLARWTDPLLGVVNPVEFVSRAEATGQIDALGLSILRQAVQAAVVIGLPARGIAIGVNVSASQLRRQHGVQGFADDVALILAEFGLPPRMLAIEVTESILIEEHGPAVDELRRLRAIGVHIAIDDFGSGYWALGYFRWLTADVLKIDRSLIASLAEDERSRAVVASIVDLSRRMGMQTIAEGVEDDEVAAVAGQLGVDALQGWNYARAVPISELTRTIDHLDGRAGAIRMAAGFAPAPSRTAIRAGA